MKDDLMKRAKELLRTARAQRRWWAERCGDEAGDPFKETVSVLAALIKRVEPKK